MKANLLVIGVLSLSCSLASARWDASPEVVEQLTKLALANELVKATIAQSARDVDLIPEQCSVMVKNATGEKTKDGIDGEITLTFNCASQKKEANRFGEIEGDVFSNFYLVRQIRIETAG